MQSIKKDFDAINAFLQQRKITLTDRISQVCSFEDEIKIEQAFKEYLDTYLSHSSLEQSQLFELFGTAIFEITSNFVDDRSAQDAHVQDEYLPKSLRELLLIFLNRVKHGVHLTLPQRQVPVFNFQTDAELSKIIGNLTESCRLHAGIVITDENLKFLQLLLLGHGIGISDRSNPLSSTDDFTVAAHSLIKQVETTLGVNFRDDNELLRITIYHLIPMVSRLSLGLHISDPLKSEIFNHHQLIAQTVKMAASPLENHYRVTLSDDEVSLLALHFLVAVERHRKQNHLLVVCHAGAEISQYVLLALKNNLPENNELVLISPSELSKINLNAFDMVVSATAIVGHKIPVMYVSVLPREEEIEPIYWKLVDIYRQRANYLAKPSVQ
ncbi:BglG family transcription antiterminator [Furfurilactobacillus sp. WILCCON 0119]